MLVRCSAVLLLLASSATAGTLKVPADFPTIQAAVDAAVDGDTVLVAKGVYPESVLIQDKSDLLLRGAGKPVIDATGQVNGLVVDNCSDVEVRGFVVRNAQTNDVLIQFSGGVTVTKCRIEASVTGVKSESASDMHILHNDIRDQSSNGVWFAANPAISPPEIVANRLRGMEDVGLRVDMPGTRVEKNRIDGPLQTGLELGTGADEVTISRNRISGASVGGVVINSGAGHTAERNRIKDGGIGLFFVAGTGASTLRNKITGALGVGLRVDADGCTLEGDRCTSGLAGGLELNGNGNVLTDIVVSKAGTNGLAVSGSDNELTACKALHSGGIGLLVSGTGNSFTQVKAKGSGDFDLQDTDATDSNTYDGCSFGTEAP